MNAARYWILGRLAIELASFNIVCTIFALDRFLHGCFLRRATFEGL